jgi:hypothetical protein
MNRNEAIRTKEFYLSISQLYCSLNSQLILKLLLPLQLFQFLLLCNPNVIRKVLKKLNIQQNFNDTAEQNAG